MSKILIATGVAAIASVMGYFIGAESADRPEARRISVTPNGIVVTEKPKAGAAMAAPAVQAAAWAAAAPGRVEPRTGEFRIGAGAMGRVAEVIVAVRSTVEEDELLLRLEDDEARARLAAAETEVSVRKQERDRQPATPGREELRRAEDQVYAAERAVFGARYALLRMSLHSIVLE